MKTYDQLTPEQQTKAQEKALNSLLEAITSQNLAFNDELNGDDLQARIDAAGEKAEKLQTPWFWAEIIMEDEKCADILRGMALCNAEDALYPAPDEAIIHGIAA